MTLPTIPRPTVTRPPKPDTDHGVRYLAACPGPCRREVWWRGVPTDGRASSYAQPEAHECGEGT